MRGGGVFSGGGCRPQKARAVSVPRGPLITECACLLSCRRGSLSPSFSSSSSSSCRHLQPLTMMKFCPFQDGKAPCPPATFPATSALQAAQTSTITSLLANASHRRRRLSCGSTAAPAAPLSMAGRASRPTPQPFTPLKHHPPLPLFPLKCPPPHTLSPPKRPPQI